VTRDVLNAFWPALVFSIVLMVFVWIVSHRLQNLGIVDIAWAFGFAPVAVFYASVLPGDLAHRLLITGMAGLWSLRLGVHIAFRVAAHHPKEDPRYCQLRTEWAGRIKSKTFRFFQLQAALLAVLSTPFLFISLNSRPGFRPVEWAGVVLWSIAVTGEALADYQLNRFNAAPENRGRVCQTGLWRYSRHPNYFFEWLIWVSFFLFALGSPWGWITFFCPVLMLFFLLRVTGIPMTEQLALKSKGAEYERYQQTTSTFVPWFRKEA
jgi:steroid 5-alpha reductase family enzyme